MGAESGPVSINPFMYRARCSTCGYIVRERIDSTFLDPWFLPTHCVKCGEHKDRYATFLDKAGWTLDFGRYVRARPFKLTRPSTWFVGQVWEEKHD